ncbi:hypothetical protein TREMEDRAFT_28753, partial [Tremella mesenterica DSM 1558]|uniref:uncharacterized protein n=1 Tax=Tremella mesenterica (strain ATCC 24925 / CBS 8224 / DSM 1558 / NBRC 9311 / NRRL Y-6157 / RJB 2259-6 / UBC 559-6) TaxID=578456 RepID=UPI0003F4A5D9
NQQDFETADDPTGGYVNYVSKSDAQSLSLVDIQSSGEFVMRADSDNQASGRGRNSVRISSKDKFGDGVYILDVNHMPVGCGTWPAFWTTTKTGWPSGGEIDILEVRNTASLHTADNCVLPSGTYQTGELGRSVCAADLSGNTGCGVELGGQDVYGVDSFGHGVNEVSGGWYAMWRDVQNSGGVYVYYWPRNATNVPDDVKNVNTVSTNVAGWGEPSANLSIPTCKGDFNDHVIVFNLAFCGDYAEGTYTTSGCPSTCSSFVMNHPQAFTSAYWSINSLRVYTSSGKPASGGGLSTGSIVGIVVGVVVGVCILFVGFLVCRRRRMAG